MVRVYDGGYIGVLDPEWGERLRVDQTWPGLSYSQEGSGEEKEMHFIWNRNNSNVINVPVLFHMRRKARRLFSTRYCSADG